MKRSEYMESLERELRSLGAQDSSEFVREMESHVDELQERHPEKGEEEIIAGLTPPDILARALREEFGDAEGSASGGPSGDAGDRGWRPPRPPRPPRPGDPRAEGEGRDEKREAGREEGGRKGFSFKFDLGPDFERDMRSLEEELRKLGEEKLKMKVEFDKAGEEWKSFGETIARSVREAVRSFSGFGDSDDREWEGNIETGGATILRLAVKSGDISIERGEGGAIEASIDISGEEEALALWKPDVEIEDGRITIGIETEGICAGNVNLRLPHSILQVELRSMSGDVEIDAAGLSADLQSKSGDMRLSGLVSLRAKTTSGDIEVDGLGGPVEIGTVSGSVRIEGAPSATTVFTVSGDIELEEQAGALSLETTSGDVGIQATEAFEGGSATSVSGDMRVDIGGASLALSAETVSGDIDAPGARDDDSGMARRWKAQLGEGGKELRLKSVSGDISVEF